MTSTTTKANFRWTVHVQFGAESEAQVSETFQTLAEAEAFAFAYQWDEYPEVKIWGVSPCGTVWQPPRPENWEERMAPVDDEEEGEGPDVVVGGGDCYLTARHPAV